MNLRHILHIIAISYYIKKYRLKGEVEEVLVGGNISNKGGRVNYTILRGAIYTNSSFITFSFRCDITK